MMFRVFFWGERKSLSASGVQPPPGDIATELWSCA